MDILRQYSPDVEQYSVDEAYVDMTGTEGLWGEPLIVAGRIKNQIRDTLGFTVNIGISETNCWQRWRLTLKNLIGFILWKDEIEEKMWVLPVSDCFS